MTLDAAEKILYNPDFINLLHSLKIQYPVGKTWVTYQEYANKGYSVTGTVITKNGGSAMQTKWTQKEREALYYKLKTAGILPLREHQETMSELF